ncbi:MAG: hypothetical protein J5626_05080 [Lachnospiraceae bacterium]|nr:hypothetical protein [Lachnospiraceae bacterium]
MRENVSNTKGKSIWFYIIVIGQAFSILLFFMKLMIIKLPFNKGGEYGILTFSETLKEAYEGSGVDYAGDLALFYICGIIIAAASISAVVFCFRMFKGQEPVILADANAAVTMWVMLIGSALFWAMINYSNNMLRKENFGSGFDAIIGDYYGDIISVTNWLPWAIGVSIVCLVARFFCLKEAASIQPEYDAANSISKEGSAGIAKETLVCPNCGAKCSDGLFCTNCGGKLTALKVGKVCRVCGAKYEEGRFCKKCGAEHPIEAEQKSTVDMTEREDAVKDTVREVPGEEITRYKEAAEEGDPYSQYMYAGLVRSKNPYEAELYYTRAAEQGNVRAMCELASGYSEKQNLYTETGFGCDPKKELYWRTQAAENGDADSMLELALVYGSGEMVKQDEAEEARWLQNAADHGNAEAFYRLSLLPIYQYNRKMRIELLRKAIEASKKSNDKSTFAQATFGLGLECIPNGNDGEAAKQAVYFFYLAFFSGNDEALEETKGISYSVTTEELETWKKDAEQMKISM